jgi:hypothetical protein
VVQIENIAEQLPRNPAHPQWKLRPVSGITRIVVHYDAVRVPPMKEGVLSYDPVARYTAQARYHVSRNWNNGSGPVVRGFGLMYHYRVSADGRLWRTQPERLITWHARNANRSGLAVCCDLGAGQSPGAAQLRGLRALLDWLCYRRPDLPAGRSDVWGHGELRAAGNATACPGGLAAWVRAYREGRG